mmetsp:Transcript_122581/g.318697  ORF Transcript_122581/g.318697 Transcript_122581/m.318697 type:complete len:219 (-) Transcript_122581:669-1325(-)
MPDQTKPSLVKRTRIRRCQFTLIYNLGLRPTLSLEAGVVQTCVAYIPSLRSAQGLLRSQCTSTSEPDRGVPGGEADAGACVLAVALEVEVSLFHCIGQSSPKAAKLRNALVGFLSTQSAAAAPPPAPTPISLISAHASARGASLAASREALKLDDCSCSSSSSTWRSSGALSPSSRTLEERASSIQDTPSRFKSCSIPARCCTAEDKRPDKMRQVFAR